MLEVELVRRGIDYDYRGGVRFFERAHIKDARAFLRVWNSRADMAAWLRVLMHEEGIGPAAAQKVIEKVRQVSEVAKVREVGLEVLGSKAQVGWNNFVRIWDAMAKAPDPTPAGLIEAVLDSPYREYLESEFVDSRERL